MARPGLDEAINRYHAAGAELVKGNPEPQKDAFSRDARVTLVNPAGVIARGWAEVAATVDRVAARFREGEIEFKMVSCEITSELAYIVEIEGWRGRVGGSEEVSSGQLRVTSVLRPEEGTWKVVHRHADPIPPNAPPS